MRIIANIEIMLINSIINLKNINEKLRIFEMITILRINMYT